MEIGLDLKYVAGKARGERRSVMQMRTSESNVASPVCLLSLIRPLVVG